MTLSDQDQLEEVLDVAVANQRYVLAERSAQRKFLVQSLHSLDVLISDTFSSTSSNLESWFSHIRRLVQLLISPSPCKYQYCMFTLNNIQTLLRSTKLRTYYWGVRYNFYTKRYNGGQAHLLL